MKPVLTSSDPPGWYRCRVVGFTVPVYAVRWWNGERLVPLEREERQHSFPMTAHTDFQRMEVVE